VINKYSAGQRDITWRAASARRRAASPPAQRLGTTDGKWPRPAGVAFFIGASLAAWAVVIALVRLLL
jgi:hypothetical protein